MNVKYSQGYRKYNSEIPSFLVNRPRILVLHCIERIFTAKDIKSQHIECTDISKGTFKIKSQSQDGSWYLLSFGDSETMCRCGCPDWQKWWLPCKHFIAIFNTYPAWQWENLSSLYLPNYWRTIDNSTLRRTTRTTKHLRKALTCWSMHFRCKKPSNSWCWRRPSYPPKKSQERGSSVPRSTGPAKMCYLLGPQLRGFDFTTT